MYWLVNHQKELVYGNQRFIDFFKLDPQSIQGQALSQLVPPAVYHTLEVHLDEVLAQHSSTRFVQTLVSHDDTESFFEIKMYPVPLGVSTEGNLFDKQAVITSYARLQLLDAVSSEAIWEWSRVRNDFYFNKTMRNLTRRETATGQDLRWFFELIAPEEITRVENIMDWNLLHSRAEWELQCRVSNGQTYQFYHCRFVARYAGKQMVQLVCVLKNIHEKQRLRNSLALKEQQLQAASASCSTSATEKLKQHIGRELHDSVNQILTSTKLYLDYLEPGLPNFEAIKEKSRQQLELAMEQIRSLSRDLVIPWFKDKGLVSCINSLVDDLMTANMNIAFTCNSQEVEKIEENLKITVYRIIQEQLKNIVQHSKAANVSVVLQWQYPDLLRLSITDDGVGFDANKIPHKSQGLNGIRDRVHAVGGALQMDTCTGKGCCLQVTMPVVLAA